jgi:phage regulator Rha-like protein
VDSRIIAKGLGVQHKNTIELISRYKTDLVATGALQVALTQGCDHREAYQQAKGAVVGYVSSLRAALPQETRHE